jgi:hypothetical protein
MTARAVGPDINIGAQLASTKQKSPASLPATARFLGARSILG